VRKGENHITITILDTTITITGNQITIS